MRVNRYRGFRAETENQIRKMANKGYSPAQIRHWLLARTISIGTESITGNQIGELMDMVPGEYYHAAG